jgi:hypothetical protein
MKNAQKMPKMEKYENYYIEKNLPVLSHTKKNTPKILVRLLDC